MSSNELVLCVRRVAVESKLKEGFNPTAKDMTIDDFNDLIQQNELVIGARHWLEKDSNYLQLLPYCVFRKPDGSVLSYQRTKLVGEQRLAGNWSIGCGGHIGVIDVCLERDGGTKTGNIHTTGTIWNNIFREILEETGVDLDIICNLNYENDLHEVHGIIFDNSNEVGKKHLGLLIVCDVDQDFEFGDNSVKIAMSEGMDLKGWWQPEDILHANDTEQFSVESWSKIVCDYLTSA